MGKTWQNDNIYDNTLIVVEFIDSRRDNMEALGERIKEYLEKNGMSQKELAEKTGCTEAAISHYIRGDRTPRASVLRNDIWLFDGGGACGC